MHRNKGNLTNVCERVIRGGAKEKVKDVDQMDVLDMIESILKENVQQSKNANA